MKRRVVTSCLVLGLLTHLCLAEEQAALESELDKISYSVGFQMGEGFKRQGVPLNMPILYKGIEDALADADPLLSSEERQAAITSLKRTLVLAQQQRQRAQAEKNLEASKAFLATNASKEGVITLPDGLQYKPIKSGDGKSPKANDKVTVHYTGKLINGVEFDSSKRRGKPATFQVDKVIPGWTEALQLMHEGDKWELYIPPELGYGDQAAGGKIPANSALIFEVELISVN